MALLYWNQKLGLARKEEFLRRKHAQWSNRRGSLQNLTSLRKHWLCYVRHFYKNINKTEYLFSGDTLSDIISAQNARHALYFTVTVRAIITAQSAFAYDRSSTSDNISLSTQNLPSSKIYKMRSDRINMRSCLKE